MDKGEDNSLEQINETNMRWRYRRRISIVAFISILIVLFGTLIGYFQISEDMITKTIVDGLFLIVLTYMGVAAVDDIAFKYIEQGKLFSSLKKKENLPENERDEG